MERTLVAPHALSVEHRVRFRQEAVQLLDALPVGTGRLVVDLRDTRAVDSAGLGALIIVQRHAASRRQAVRLANANDEIRFLLMLTKLEDLFDLDAPAA